MCSRHCSSRPLERRSIIRLSIHHPAVRSATRSSLIPLSISLFIAPVSRNIGGLLDSYIMYRDHSCVRKYIHCIYQQHRVDMMLTSDLNSWGLVCVSVSEFSGAVSVSIHSTCHKIISQPVGSWLH